MRSVPRICAQCNSGFTYTSEGRGRLRQYCSAACKGEAKRQQFREHMRRYRLADPTYCRPPRQPPPPLPTLTGNCPVCMKDFTYESISFVKTFCSMACRREKRQRQLRAAHRQEVNCPTCGTPFVTNGLKKYCSLRCNKPRPSRKGIRRPIKRILSLVITCTHCDKEFHPKERNRITFCSRECARAWRKLRAIPRRDRLETERLERQQAAESLRRQRASDQSATDEAARITSCKVCDVTFRRVKGQHRICSPCLQAGIKARQKAERKRNRAKGKRDHGKHLVRARRWGARVIERFRSREIYERDGWICWICSQPVDQTVSAPHPLSHSLDHVIPLRWGGDHSRENARCAHFLCNSKRGDNVDFNAAFKELISKGSTQVHVNCKEFGPMVIGLLTDEEIQEEHAKRRWLKLIA